jgi:trimethylamine--corrinoid protein Co-methyltransferase
MLKGFMRKFRPLEILTDEEVEAIHRGILYVLETTGVKVEHDEALKLFAQNDCKVNFDEKRVRIPGWLVEESLRKCPSSFPLRARDSESDLMVGGNALYFMPLDSLRTVDLNTWEPRRPTLQDLRDAIRVLDALDSLHCQVSNAHYADMEGVPTVMVGLEALAIGIRNSVKAQAGNLGYLNESERFTIEMAKAVEMDYLGAVSVSPPLTLSTGYCEGILRAAEAQFPLLLSSGGVMGGTTPATLAGSTIADNAGTMAGIVLAQLAKCGAKVLAQEYIYPMNMQTGSPDFGAVGVGLHSVIFNQLWRSYGIPTMAGGGCACSNSKEIDFQAGYERAMKVLTSAIAGSNFLYLHGTMDGELVFHPVQAVLDDDIANWVGRFLDGVEVNDETLAIDLINEVGPLPGHYLNKEHTRKWWRKEHFVPRVADRESYPEWREKGKKNALALAKERVEEILATHKPKPLTPEQDKTIDDILKEARSFYRKKGLI